jgi:hypothetical protein
MLAIGGAAQNGPVATKFFFAPQPVMGNVVKGAPYSADEIAESLQMLADGTRISNRNQVTVYRDGEGRVRRESPEQITIWDPVENVSYTLNPKAMTATKSAMGGNRTLYVTTDKVSPTSAAAIADVAAAKQAAEARAQTLAASLDKLKAEMQNGGMVVNGSPASEQTAVSLKEQLDVATEKLSQVNTRSTKVESLGQQVIEGVTADGTRSTLTIEAGAIGNDRPIQVVSERWYSAELQTVVMTKRTDPRTGEETFHLSNVHRGEPGADLFVVPPGYQLSGDGQWNVRKEE